MKTKILSFVILMAILCSNSYALIYDDFNGNSINSSLWNVSYNGSGGFDPLMFSASGSSLNAHRPTYGYGSSVYGFLSSTTTISGDFQLVVDYSGFSTDGISAGDAPQLALFVSPNGQTHSSEGIQRYAWADNGKINELFSGLHWGTGNPSPSNATSDSGQMMIARNGSNIGTFYNEGNGWISLGYYSDLLMGDLTFGLEFYTGDGGTFNVDINSVELFEPAPVPEPATMLLLGSGFVGLAALRKKTKRS